MNLDINGLRVLVTAGANGIGLAIARAFVREGARVHACDVDDAALAALANSDPSITQTKCDVSDRVDPFFVGLKVFVHRTSARAAQWGVGHQLQVGFGPNRHDGEASGKSHPAFGLDILDHSLPLEAVQIFIEQQRDAGLQIGFGQPLGSLEVQEVLPDDFVPTQQAQLCARTRQKRGDFGTEKP